MGTARLLLARGAPIAAVDGNGSSALLLACLEGQLEAAELLVEEAKVCRWWMVVWWRSQFRALVLPPSTNQPTIHTPNTKPKRRPTWSRRTTTGTPR